MERSIGKEEGSLTAIDLTCDGKNFRVFVEDSENGLNLDVDGSRYYVVLEGRQGNELQFSVNGKKLMVEYHDEGMNRVTLGLSGSKLEYYRGISMVHGAASPSLGSVIKSPLPGRIIDVKVSRGQQVKPGDPLVVMESMKMETTIRADRDAVISSVDATKGEFIKKGQPLLTYE